MTSGASPDRPNGVDGQVQHDDHSERDVNATNEVGVVARNGVLWRRDQRSILREWLESDMEFEWPDGVGTMVDGCCEFESADPIPLKWERTISDGKNCNSLIEVYQPEAKFGFKLTKPLVSKQILTHSAVKNMVDTAKEVSNMKDLRYPHVAAFLGTFKWRTRIHILIFPVAICDLSNFLNRATQDLNQVVASSKTKGHKRQISFEQRQLDSEISAASGDAANAAPKSHLSRHADVRDHISWLLELPLEGKQEYVRSWFPCIVQALQYLHDSGIRHKDIKPQNILLDETGSPVLTDFGLSNRTPKNSPSMTSNERNFTKRYASPEAARGSRGVRDWPSDIFSLGCVFLEMMSVVCCRTAPPVQAYSESIPRAHDWLSKCKTQVEQESSLSSVTIKGDNIPPSTVTLSALTTIKGMMEELPEKRPLTPRLWTSFASMSAHQCRDCHSDHLKKWKPSADQRSAVDSGRRKRNSKVLEHDKRLSLPPTLPSIRGSGSFLENLRLGRSSQSQEGMLQTYKNLDHRRALSNPSRPSSPNELQMPLSSIEEPVQVSDHNLETLVDSPGQQKESLGPSGDALSDSGLLSNKSEEFFSPFVTTVDSLVPNTEAPSLPALQLNRTKSKTPPNTKPLVEKPSPDAKILVFDLTDNRVLEEPFWRVASKLRTVLGIDDIATDERMTRTTLRDMLNTGTWITS